MKDQVLTEKRTFHPLGCPDQYGIVLWSLPTGSAHRTEVRARSLVRDALREVGITGDDLLDAETVVAELALNAAQHAIPPYELRIFYVGGYLPIWCEVVDGGPIADVIAKANLAAEGGRGLQIVHGLTEGRCAAYPTSASEPGVRGKAVGFALPLPRRDAR